MCYRNTIRCIRIARNELQVSEKCHQFQYKKPPLLFAVTNTYGVVISTSEEYFSRSQIYDIRALQPRHRVSLLVPTIPYWWNVESKTMMSALWGRFITDMKCLAASHRFRSAVERFGIVDIKEVVKPALVSWSTYRKQFKRSDTFQFSGDYW